MVETVFKLKQSGVPYESGKELVTKSKTRTQTSNSQQSIWRRLWRQNAEVIKISYFPIKTVMKKTHGYAAYDMNGG